MGHYVPFVSSSLLPAGHPAVGTSNCFCSLSTILRHFGSISQRGVREDLMHRLKHHTVLISRQFGKCFLLPYHVLLDSLSPEMKSDVTYFQERYVFCRTIYLWLLLGHLDTSCGVHVQQNCRLILYGTQWCIPHIKVYAPSSE